MTASTLGVSAPSTTPQQWRIIIPTPPEGFLSLNKVNRGHWSVSRRIARAWRTAAYQAAQIHRLPTGLARVRIEVVLRFPDRRLRDASNYESTVKPIVDGLGPRRVYRDKHGKLHVDLGYGLIPGDDARYLDKPATVIGEPARPTPDSPRGWAQLTITDLSGVPR